MRAMERFKSWYRRSVVADNTISDGSVHDEERPTVSCSCIPRSKSSGVYEMRKEPDPNAGALADIKASNRSNHQKGLIPKRHMSRSAVDINEFFEDYGESDRYVLKEIIGKGSYGVVCSALDTITGNRVAIKKIKNVFDHVSDATRILREIKLLRMLKHNDIVEIKRIMLPPHPRDFKDIYVVFELMETDLHQVIKANDDLTPEHHQFFLYQLLRGLKFIHSACVYHRDLKPKNILANSDCKLKICDFGLARPSLQDLPTTIYWTDYVATRWYRAPELCGSFFAKYSPAIDIWSVGCIFAEVLLGKPLFPGRNVVHQLELITDQLGSPSPEEIAKVKNEKARRFLNQMRHKTGVPFEQSFPTADRGALRLLKKMLEFDAAARPTAEEALADPYFQGLASPAREPTSTPISKLAFDFERRKLSVTDVQELIYREILEYHPDVMIEYLSSTVPQPQPMYRNPLDTFKWHFGHLEGATAPVPGATLPPHGSGSIPRDRVQEYQNEAARYTARHVEDEEAAAAHERAKSIESLGHAVIGMSVSEHRRRQPPYATSNKTSSGSAPKNTASTHHPVRSSSLHQR